MDQTAEFQVSWNAHVSSLTLGGGYRFASNILQGDPKDIVTRNKLRARLPNRLVKRFWWGN